MAEASGGTWWEKTVYNALGEMVAASYPDGSYTVTHVFPRDIFGHRTEIFDDRPSIGWVGADEWFARVAGQQVLMGGSTSWLVHKDAIGTTTMVTDQTGAASGDVLYDTWGNRTGGGGSNGDVFGGLGMQINQVLPPSATRYYNPGLDRWLTPDKLGGSVLNPQSLNRYAYVDNNPASFNDPLGLFLANPQTEYVIKTTSWGWPIMYDLLSPFDVMQRPIMPNLPGGVGRVGGRASVIASSLGTVTLRNQFTLTYGEFQSLVHENNRSNRCDDLIDCIVFKESTLGGGFYMKALGVPYTYHGLPQQAKGLMQVTQGAAQTVNNVYHLATSPQALYENLFNPALNIQAGSDLLKYDLEATHGDLWQALNDYGGSSSGAYANDVLNCVQQLVVGNVPGAINASHGY